MTEIAEMTCQELTELVNAYLEGALPESDQARFEEHLDICSGCRAYLDQMRRTISMTGTLRDNTLPDAVRDRLLSAFRNWKTGEPPDPQ